VQIHRGHGWESQLGASYAHLRKTSLAAAKKFLPHRMTSSPWMDIDLDRAHADEEADHHSRARGRHMNVCKPCTEYLDQVPESPSVESQRQLSKLAGEMATSFCCSNSAQAQAAKQHARRGGSGGIGTRAVGMASVERRYRRERGCLRAEHRHLIKIYPAVSTRPDLGGPPMTGQPDTDGGEWARSVQMAEMWETLSAATQSSTDAPRRSQTTRVCNWLEPPSR
jgi:hypothetical protein